MTPVLKRIANKVVCTLECTNSVFVKSSLARGCRLCPEVSVSYPIIAGPGLFMKSNSRGGRAAFVRKSLAVVNVFAAAHLHTEKMSSNVSKSLFFLF